MDREVIWSLAAGNDLVAIAEYISRDSDAYAAAVVREIVTAGRSLCTSLLSGAVGYPSMMTLRLGN